MTLTKILVVEDEGIVALEIEMRLQGLGYSVCGLAASGDAALKKIEETHPDLVLMDIHLRGDIDGVDTAAQIRARYDTPVVYLTAFADADTLRRAKQTEPYGYITKPFEERDLYTTIEIALYKQKIDAKLKESEQWLTTTLRSIGDGVIASDVAGRVKFINPVAEALVGWKQRDALGRELVEVFRASSVPPKTTGQVAVAVRDDIVRVGSSRAVLVARDGRETPIVGTAAPIRDERGRVLGAVLVFREVAQEREAEEEWLTTDKWRRLPL